MVVKFLDLFAGMGGLRLGFEKAFEEKGITTTCIGTSEIKAHAIEALSKNFVENHFLGDVCKIDTDTLEDFDVLLAGFPCQAFSFAGHRLGFSDTRGTLFFEVERILKAKKPYAFILENVEGLIKHDSISKTDKIGRTFDVILNSLKSLGYQVSWNLLDASDFGVAQTRKRVFIVGTKDTFCKLNDFPIKKSCFEDVMQKGLPTINNDFSKKLFSRFSPEDLYGKAIKDKRGGSENIHSWDLGLKGSVSKDQSDLLGQILKERRKKKWAIQRGVEWKDGMPLTLGQIQAFNNLPNLKDLLDDLVLKGYLHADKITTNKETQEQDTHLEEIGYNIVVGKLSFEFTTILHPKKNTPTLVAMDLSKIGVIDNNGIRCLSFDECLGLFGFPKEYSLSFFEDRRKLGYDLLGNSVAVPVAQWVSSQVCEIMQNQ